MRTILALALVLLTSTAIAADKPHHKPKVIKVKKAVKVEAKIQPTILRQRSGGTERVLITITNPLPRPVWVYIECPNSLTETPVGIPGHTTADVNLYCGIEPGGECLLNHWILQNGHSPPAWEP